MKKLFVCVIWFAASSVRALASEPFNCPDTISVHQELATPIEGWNSMLDDTPNRLANVTFYDGPPSEKASLVNDRTTKSTGKETAIWQFNFQANRDIWMACGYAGTTVTLAKALPKKITSCSITYNTRQRVAGNPVVETISCKEK